MDTRTFEVLQHDPKIISTVQLNCEYDPKAKCPLFKKYLSDVFTSDKQRINVMQEILGYLLSKDTQAQKAIVLFGSGSNGKSVILNVISHLIGEKNIVSPSLERLGNRFVLASLYSAQLILIPEAEVRGDFKTDYFKAIVTGDLIQGEQKGKNPFNFRPTAKLLLAVNKLFFTKDKSNGYMRRLLLIHFDQLFSAELGNIDVNLGEKLQNEMSGILAYSFRGLKRLRRQNYQFSFCQSSENLLKEYRAEINPVTEFVEEVIEITSNSKDKVVNREVYDAFIQWCRYNNHGGYTNINTRKFWAEIKAVLLNEYRLELSLKHSGSIRYVCGIKLKSSLPFKTFSNKFRTVKTRLSSIDEI